jgi:hypothetical protein
MSCTQYLLTQIGIIGKSTIGINKLALLVERTPQHNESFDITGPEIMNYKELIQRTAELNYS